jgi:D-glycero-beta-D-manno-heptose 1-phosphate adenylyltransferase
LRSPKIRSLIGLKRIIAAERRRGKRIVLANGCFDLFHVGHVRYLRDSAAQGDILVVALNSDASVRALKGPGRPLMPEEERAAILASFEFVDYVTIFGQRDVAAVLEALRPDIHSKGSDYTLETVPERETVRSLGGKNFIAGGPKVRSTSDIVKSIAARKDADG